MNSTRFFFFTICLIASLFCIVGCDNNGNDVPQVNDVLVDVRIGEVAAQFVEGGFPEGDVSIRVPECAGSNEVVRGGAMVFQVGVSDSTSQLVVGLDGEFNGYYVLDVSGADGGVSSKIEPSRRGILYSKKYSKAENLSPFVMNGSSSSGIYTLLITTTSDEELEEFVLLVSASEEDVFAPPCTQTVKVNETAQSSSDLQVSLNWNAPIDMDLHIETPDENDIYYGQEIGQNGGTLDLDSNAGCSIDNINNENITWAEQEPACGEHVVRVDLWSACAQQGPFNFAVTVNQRGDVQTFQGSFDADEETQGGAFDGRVITKVNVCG